MKTKTKMFALGLLALCVTPMAITPNDASEVVTTETKATNSSIEYLKTLNNSSLLPNLSAFSVTGKMRAYIFSFDVNGKAIGYTEWHIYQNPVTQQDKDEKEAFFNKDATAHETTYGKINILNGTYDMATTYADCSGTNFVHFKAVRNGQQLSITSDAGYGVNPNFVVGFNVKDAGNPGNLHINQDNNINTYVYNIVEQPVVPQEITYEVVFDANGGIGTMTNQVVTKGQPFVLPANTFTREGYTFVGWALEPNGVVKYTDGQEVSDLTFPQTRSVFTTLYAVWEPIKQPVVQPSVEPQQNNQVVSQEPVNPTPNKSVHTGTNVGNVVGLVSTILVATIALVINRKNIK